MLEFKGYYSIPRVVEASIPGLDLTNKTVLPKTPQP
jgi:hypothetical protein